MWVYSLAADGPMLTILAALNKREVPLNATDDEELSRTTPDLLHAETQLEVQNRGEHEDGGTVAEKSREIPHGHVFGGDQPNETTHDTVHSGKALGRCW